MRRLETNALGSPARPLVEGKPACVLILFVALALAHATYAEVATDGTMGPTETLSGPRYAVGEDLGTRVGDNLFHSFKRFAIGREESATFTGASDIANVISRVTGNEISTIDGCLRSEVGTADFYFINPAGIVFGPDAQVDVPAAFHASTASELRFGDGEVFSAEDPAKSTLTSAPPEAFGFLAQQPTDITVNGTVLTFEPGSDVSLSGGDVACAGGTLTDMGGNVMISAVGVSQTSVSVQAGAIDADPGGTIAIDASLINVSGAEGLQVISLSGGLVDITRSEIAADNFGGEDSSGRIKLAADTVRVMDSDVHASVYGAGRGNDIVVDAEELIIDAASAVDGRSRLATQVKQYADGNAGDIVVTADRISMAGGGQLSSMIEEGAKGSGGAVEIYAAKFVSIAGSNDFGLYSGIITTALSGNEFAYGGNITIDSPGAALELSEGGYLQSATKGAAQSGNIMINVNNLTMKGGSQLLSMTHGAGNAGFVEIQAPEGATFDEIQIWSYSYGTGNAGNIDIRSNAIELKYSDLDASTESTGNAGDIFLAAEDHISLSLGSSIDSYTGVPYYWDEALGKAGTVRIETGDLMIEDSTIEVSSFNLSDAGNVEVFADQIRVNTSDGNSAGIKASNLFQYYTHLDPTQEARSGNISLDASRITPGE